MAAFAQKRGKPREVAAADLNVVAPLGQIDTRGNERLSHKDLQRY